MTQNQQPQQPQEIQVKATDEILKGQYANMVQVGHTHEEFIIDFMNIVPPAGQMISRIIVSPKHAKRIWQALADNLQKYEEQNGKIGDSTTLAQQLGLKTE
ncbi:MAG TPA: DUF3467 domain-containing protein [Patescibacteria group bacterium]|nr:DUF3467 domain-containing protein [Patescibacteria group bacterium]